MRTDYTANDRKVYAEELRDFLPQRIFDAHAHLFDADCRLPGTEFPPKSCYQKFGGVFPRKHYLDWAAEWLPEQKIFLNSFGHPSGDMNREASAAYTGSISDNQRFFGMALVSPRDSVEAVAERIKTRRLIGYKPYLAFVDWKPAAEVSIEDMLPEAQMALANELGLAVTLHIPRPGRLADPLNQEQMPALCRRYPKAKIIFAHIGRAYFLNNVLGQLQGIADCPNAYLDTAMVNHPGVLEYTFRHFPRERILFGSDAPIAMLRGKSVEINNQYAYLMGEEYEIGTSIFDARHAVEFTTFFYEQLRAIRLAARPAGLSAAEIEALFFGNAHRLFSATAAQFATGFPAGEKNDPPVQADRTDSQTQRNP